MARGRWSLILEPLWVFALESKTYQVTVCFVFRNNLSKFFSEPSAHNKCAKEGFPASGKGPGIQQTPSPQPLHFRLPPRPWASLVWVVAQQCGHFCKALGRNYSKVGFFLCERLQLPFDIVFDIWVLTIGVSNPHDLL